MRALVVTSSYPVRKGHLGGRFVADLLHELGAADWEFDVVLPSWSGGAAVETAPNVQLRPTDGFADAVSRGLAHGSGIPETLASEPWRWITSPALVAALADATARELARRKYDLVWSHWMLPGGLAAAPVARDAGVSHLTTAHGADVHFLERSSRWPGAGTFWRRLWSRTTITAPVSHTAGRLRHLLAGREVWDAPLPAGTRDTDEASTVANVASFLYLGRLESVKGPDLVIEAIRRMDTTSPRASRATLCVAGTGSAEMSLRRAAQSMPGRVCFAGAVEGEAKRRLLRGTTALVLPSRRLPDGRREGFPHAAMEALVQGVPVIAPRRGALGEFLEQHGAGYVYDGDVPDGEAVERLAETLAGVLRNPAERADRSARAALAGRRFTNESARRSWDVLLRGAAGVA